MPCHSRDHQTTSETVHLWYTRAHNQKKHTDTHTHTHTHHWDTIKAPKHHRNTTKFFWDAIKAPSPSTRTAILLSHHRDTGQTHANTTETIAGEGRGETPHLGNRGNTVQTPMSQHQNTSTSETLQEHRRDYLGKNRMRGHFPGNRPHSWNKP